MSETVEWHSAHEPCSLHFADVCRSDGLAQPREVFLAGCGLPGGWAGKPSCAVLEAS